MARTGSVWEREREREREREKLKLRWEIGQCQWHLSQRGWYLGGQQCGTKQHGNNSTNTPCNTILLTNGNGQIPSFTGNESRLDQKCQKTTGFTIAGLRSFEPCHKIKIDDEQHSQDKIARDTVRHQRGKVRTQAAVATIQYQDRN